MSLRDQWYIAVPSPELGGEPVARRIMGDPIALWRGPGGRATALEDRCAHRNMALSGGAVVDGTLSCPYHGWRYSADGRCVEVPSLGEGRARPVCAVRSYPVVESDGYVWVWLGAGAPAREPYRYPNLGAPGWTSFRMYNRFEAPAPACAENFLDVPHAVFVHRGLFRNPDPREHVARVERQADRVTAAFEYEPEPTSMISRFMFPRGTRVLHTDAFLLPSTTQVDYAFTADRHFTISSQCTPVSDDQTDVYTVLTWRFGRIGPLVRWLLEPLSWLIIWQDVEILRRQTAQIKLFGAPRFLDAETDLLGKHIRELRACAERGQPATACEEQVPIRF